MGEARSVNWRSGQNLSAEWTANNVGYRVTSIIPISDYNARCEHVDLEYVPDNRPVVKELTSVCEVLGWE